MRKLYCLIILFGFALKFLNAQVQTIPVIELKGYLGKEELTQAKSGIDALTTGTQKELIIIVNSGSGDLPSVLDIAKSIYALKVLKKMKLIVYMNDSAIGPAAILPFLADELYCSLYVSWGDIASGYDSYPANVLRNRVQSLIDTQNPHEDLLNTLAGAMTDPSRQVIIENGTLITSSVPEANSNDKAQKQTLVLNQNQLKELKLVKDVLSLESFRKQMHLEETSPVNVIISDYPLDVIPQNVQEKLKKHIKWDPNAENQIGYLYIGDHENSINQSTWLYVKQGLEHYKKSRPIFIILEIDTPGGEVFAAQKISDALKEIDTQYNIPIVAFINNWAISAGAMLAYACRFITTVKDGSMGAAEPVLTGESGKMETASEKINSALRADFGSRAGFYDRDPLIAEAMVDKDLILVMRHGKIMKLDNENQIRYTGADPDIMISPKGKLLTLNAEKMFEYGVADLLLPPAKVSLITEEERSKGQWPADKMLLFHAPFFSSISNASIRAYQPDWKTRFFVFLANPIVSSLLFMGLMIGAYMEFQYPGLSLPGLIAGSCLFLIILSSFALELGNWLELILLFTGLALMITELFVFPTMGILLLLGGILFLIGLFGLLLPGLDAVHFEHDSQSFNAAGQFVLERLAWLSGAFILSGIIIAILGRYFLPRFAGINPLVLVGDEQDASKGYIASDAPQTLPQPGAEGVAFATLRPAGKVMIADRVYDAMSPGGLIEAGEAIIVLRLEGSVIIVARKEGNLTL